MAQFVHLAIFHVLTEDELSNPLKAVIVSANWWASQVEEGEKRACQEDCSGGGDRSETCQWGSFRFRGSISSSSDSHLEQITGALSACWICNFPWFHFVSKWCIRNSQNKGTGKSASCVCLVLWSLGGKDLSSLCSLSIEDTSTKWELMGRIKLRMP